MSVIGGPKGFIPFEKPAQDLKTKSDEGQQSENQKVREVADMYEKFFIKELMRHMKSGLNEDGGMIKKNNAEKIFTEQLDEQYSDEWNKRGGFGMSDLIYQNVTERYAGQLGEVKKDGLDQVKDLKMVKPDDLNHEQMLWQIEMSQKDLKK